MATMQYSIRPAKRRDIAPMYRISISAHADSYYDQLIPDDSIAEFRKKYTVSVRGRRRFTKNMLRRLNSPNWHVLVAADKKNIFGYTTAELDGVVLDLKGLFILPAYQKMGIGSSLMTSILELTESSTPTRLLVLSKNEAAKKLYTKYGFKYIGRGESSFFGASQDVMER